MIQRTRTRVVAPAALPAPVSAPEIAPAPLPPADAPSPPEPSPARVRVRVTKPEPATGNESIADQLAARFAAGLWVVAAQAKAHRVRPPAGYAQYCQFFVRETVGGKPVALLTFEVRHRHRTVGMTGYDDTLVAPDARTAVDMFHAANPDYVAIGVAATRTSVRCYRI